MFWIDFTGKEVSYGHLPASGIMTMNTFVTHPWIAKMGGTKTRLHINGAEVFQPKIEHQDKQIDITDPNGIYPSIDFSGNERYLILIYVRFRMNLLT